MSDRWRAGTRGVVLGLILAVVVSGCTPGEGLPEAAGAPAATPASGLDASLEPVPTLTIAATATVTGGPSVDATLAPIAAGQAPQQQYVVRRREIAVTRDGRPLRTILLHPTVGLVGGQWRLPAGQFPLILFSHGLRGTPELYEQSLRTIAAAGFVVAAPEYPHTSADAAEYNPVDLVNQPADASAVITAVLALNSAEDDPLAGHLDPNRVAAMGHSAGGYTTMGMLAAVRDTRLRAAVVLAGGSLGGSYASPAVPVLFVHGAEDSVVPYGQGRTAFNLLPWPKALLTIIEGGHADYFDRDSPASTAVAATVLDFLRATLYGDAAALARVPANARVDLVTIFESNLTESG